MLRVTYFENEDTGRAVLPIEPTDHVVTEQYIFHEGNYDFGFGEKFHRISSFDADDDLNNFDIVAVVQGEGYIGTRSFGHDRSQ